MTPVSRYHALMYKAQMILVFDTNLFDTEKQALK